MTGGYLLVRVEGRPYGLPLAGVLEVDDAAEVLEVPRVLPAMRGLTPRRGRLVPLVHLGALLGDRSPPAERGRATVFVELGPAPAGREGAAVGGVGGVGVTHRLVALEVDDADEVVRTAALPMPPGESMPWAGGVAQHEETLVPILDLAVLEDRMQ